MPGDHISPGTRTRTDNDAAVTQRRCDWLTAGPHPHDGPSCLYVGLVAPHFPLVTPQDFYGLYPHESLPEPKLPHKQGSARHPWVENQNAFMDSDAISGDVDARRVAITACYGLTSWLDHNIGRVLTPLDEAGLGADTTIIHAYDHGNNVGARGLWGKPNTYEESAAIPLIIVGPDHASDHDGWSITTCERPMHNPFLTAMGSRSPPAGANLSIPAMRAPARR